MPSFLTSRSNSMHIFSCICRYFYLPCQLLMLPSFSTWPTCTLIAGLKSCRCCRSASLLSQHQCFGWSCSENFKMQRGKQKLLIISRKLLLIRYTVYRFGMSSCSRTSYHQLPLMIVRTCWSTGYIFSTASREGGHGCELCSILCCRVVGDSCNQFMLN